MDEITPSLTWKIPILNQYFALKDKKFPSFHLVQSRKCDVRGGDS